MTAQAKRINTIQLAEIHDYAGLLHSTLSDVLRTASPDALVAGAFVEAEPMRFLIPMAREVNRLLLESDDVAPDSVWSHVKVSPDELERAWQEQGWDGRWPERWAAMILHARRAKAEGWCGATRCYAPEGERGTCGLDYCHGAPDAESRDRTEPAPAVGMGATYCGWSDRMAYTIIEVSPSGAPRPSPARQGHHPERAQQRGRARQAGLLPRRLHGPHQRHPAVPLRPRPRRRDHHRHPPEGRNLRPHPH